MQPLYPSNVLPRFDLREEAFRKYENLIAKACKGSFDFDPADMPGRGLNARTLCTRFKDAILGFRRYGYESKLVDKAYDFRRIKPLELTNGMVRFENLAEDAKATDKRLMPSAEHPDEILAAIAHLDAWAGDLEDPTCLPPEPQVVRVAYSSPAALASLGGLVEGHCVRLSARADLPPGVAELRWNPRRA